MRSQSETVFEPLLLDESAPRRERGVARLQFRRANLSEFEEAAISECIVPAASSGQVSAAEVEALREELRTQAEQFRVHVKEAELEAADAARTKCSEEFTLRLTAERERVAKLCAQFERERARYFSGAEAEIVKLALAIAAQVLHREVRLDPLLLLGVVRVALEQIRDAGSAVLRVPVSEREAWQESLTETGEIALQVVGDERLSSGDCVLESSVGRANMGIRAQLEEIERGFFDLLEKRPA